MAGLEQISREDSFSSIVNGIPVGVHFYYIDSTLYGQDNINLAPITRSGQVLSFLYAPFIERKDLDLIMIPYDQERYGSVGTSTQQRPICNVFRIADTTKLYPKALGHVKKYNNEGYNRTVNYAWFNESKLFQFPYNYLTINDYINAPLLIEPHLFENNIPDFEVVVKQDITYNGGYTIFARGYKGDYTGALEGLQCMSSLELPTGSTSYADFMSRSKSQFITSNQIASRNEALARYTTNKQAQLGYQTAQMQYNAQIQAGKYNAVGTLLGGLGGGLFGMLGAGVSAGLGLRANQAQASASQNISNAQTNMAQHLGNLNNNLSRHSRIASSQAFISDLFTAPRNISLTGSDLLQSVNQSKRQIDVRRYGIQTFYRDRIAMYFTMYGYKQNKFIKLTNASFKTRKYWNYIKTIDANIEGHSIPKDIVDQLKEIFNTGITFWHYENMENIIIQKPDQDPQFTRLRMYEYTTYDNMEVGRPYPGTNTVIPEKPPGANPPIGQQP